MTNDVSLTLLKKRNEILDAEVKRLRAMVPNASDTPRILGTGGEVMPGKLAREKEWHKPDRYIWPGTVIHRLSKGTLDLVQFIVWDKNRGQYILLTWRPMFLEVVQDAQVTR